MRQTPLCFHRRRGRGAAVGNWGRRLLKNTLLYFLLLLQGFDERRFQPVGVLGLQNLFLTGRHAVFTEDSAAFCLVVPPAAGEVGFALGAGEGLPGNVLRQCCTRLSWIERDGNPEAPIENGKSCWSGVNEIIRKGQRDAGEQLFRSWSKVGYCIWIIFEVHKNGTIATAYL